MTKRFLLAATILFAAVFYFAPQPEAKAIDPVTMAILAPLAIQAAKILAPYVIRALGHMAKVLVRAGKKDIDVRIRFIANDFVVDIDQSVPWPPLLHLDVPYRQFRHQAMYGQKADNHPK